MAQRINTPTSVAFNFPVNLDSLTIYLRIYWNSRAASWFIDVFNSEEEAIELGVRIVPNNPLVLFGIDSWNLDGNLFVSPTATSTEISEDDQKISRTNFGGTNNYQLFYVPFSEYSAFIL